MLRILEKSVRFSLDLGIGDLILGKVLEIREQGKRDKGHGMWNKGEKSGKSRTMGRRKGTRNAVRDEETQANETVNKAKKHTSSRKNVIPNKSTSSRTRLGTRKNKGRIKPIS